MQGINWKFITGPLHEYCACSQALVLDAAGQAQYKLFVANDSIDGPFDWGVLDVGGTFLASGRDVPDGYAAQLAVEAAFARIAGR